MLSQIPPNQTKPRDRESEKVSSPQDTRSPGEPSPLRLSQYQTTEAGPILNTDQVVVGNPPSNNIKMSPGDIRDNLTEQTGGSPKPKPQKEEEEYTLANFSVKKVRMGFIKKTLGLIFSQFLVTVVACILPFVSAKVGSFMVDFWYIGVVTLCLAVILLYTAIYTRLGRKVPINFVMLFAFSIFASYSVATLAAGTDAMTVLLAAGITLVMVLALTLYALCTKSDFTGCGGYMVVGLAAVGAAGAAAYFFVAQNKIASLVICSIGVIFFGV